MKTERSDTPLPIKVVKRCRECNCALAPSEMTAGICFACDKQKKQSKIQPPKCKKCGKPTVGDCELCGDCFYSQKVEPCQFVVEDAASKKARWVDTHVGLLYAHLSKHLYIADKAAKEELLNITGYNPPK